MSERGWVRNTRVETREGEEGGMYVRRNARGWVRSAQGGRTAREGRMCEEGEEHE